MPNNFKLTGDYYVSKFGNDAWSGTSPDAPKRTIQAALNIVASGNRRIIIGSGYYKEAISYNSVVQARAYLIGDGIVTIDGGGLAISIIFATPNSSLGYGTEISNISFINFSTLSLGVSFGGVPGAGRVFTGGNIYFNYFYTAYTTFYFVTEEFIILNSSVSILGTPGVITTRKSIFINTRYSTTVSVIINDCYFDSTSAITAGPSITSFNYNNIQGSILINAASVVTSGIIQDTFARYYDLSQAGNGGSGSLAEPYKRGDTILKPFNFSNHRIAYPTLNPSSSAVDPKFNSIEDQDFTLQADSWHIGRASDGISNIGGTKYALRRASNISFSGSSATVDPSLIFQYNNYIISGSELTGSITSAPIAVSPLSSSKVIQKVTYNGLLAFNKDTGSASGSNQNVPDFDTFTSASGNAAANPDRLVYYMRHTTGSSIPVSDAGWDNGGLWTAGQYNVFEWNTKPSIDNLGVGNGSGSFNAAASPTYIQATYVQMRVRLRNDYLL